MKMMKTYFSKPLLFACCISASIMPAQVLGLEHVLVIGTSPNTGGGFLTPGDFAGGGGGMGAPVGLAGSHGGNSSGACIGAATSGTCDNTNKPNPWTREEKEEEEVVVTYDKSRELYNRHVQIFGDNFISRQALDYAQESMSKDQFCKAMERDAESQADNCKIGVAESANQFSTQICPSSRTTTQTYTVSHEVSSSADIKINITPVGEGGGGVGQTSGNTQAITVAGGMSTTDCLAYIKDVTKRSLANCDRKGDILRDNLHRQNSCPL